MSDLVRIQVNAPQTEIDRWSKYAKQAQRSLSSWLRQLANTNSSAQYRSVAFDVKDNGDQMHSHDRTLISKLGFGDADKQDSRHDLACQYLTTEAGAVFGVRGKCVGHLEQPLNKGTGKYKTTIGFVDVCGLVGVKERPFVIEVKIKPVGVGDILRQVALYREYAPNLNCFRDKISYLAADDDDDDDDDDVPKLWALWGLVADFDLSDSALKALESADIHFARLGPGFEKWLKQATAKSSKKVKVL